MNKFFIITGASGSGKTKVLNLLSNRLENIDKAIALLHFDSIGVPSKEEMTKLYGSFSEWQRIKTNEWMKRLSEGVHAYDYVFLEGQMRISFIQKALSQHNLKPAQIILLDCSDQVRKTRLCTNRNQPGLANDQMMSWAEFLRQEAKKELIPIIDTSLLTMSEVVEKILQIANIDKKTGTCLVEVVPYDPEWPKLFNREANQIQVALKDSCIAIYHIGSTAVPGLAAKPKIDIIVVVREPEKSIKQLAPLGFDYRGEYNIPMHYGFSKRGSIDVNLHVYENHHPEIELNLTFRDYLRKHHGIRKEYAALKFGLLEKRASFEKNDSMFTGYNLGKNSFILRILKEAGFDRLRFVICTHFTEWDAAKHFRQKLFFDKVLVKDPYEWTFHHKNHMHFILYKGVEIIGYAHIQLWPNSRSALRIIVVDEKLRNQGLGGQFLSWIETWLKKKGYQSIHTESSPDALRFYRKQGYMEMPFNDPDEYEKDERDIPMGKILIPYDARKNG